MIVQVVWHNDSWDVCEVRLDPGSGVVQDAICVDDRIVACWRRHQRTYAGWCRLESAGQRARIFVIHEHLHWGAFWRRLGTPNSGA